MPTNNARPADRKRQVVERAAELLLTREYPQVSMADIARAAGVTAPSLYRHFTDKQDLLAAVVLLGVEDMENCATRALSASKDREQAIARLVTMATDAPMAVVLWRWNNAYLSAEQNREVGRRTRAVLQQWADHLLPDRETITDADAMALSWSTLCVLGSLSVHHTRISSARARARLTVIVKRLLVLHPAEAPALTPSPSAPPAPGRREEILDAAAQLFHSRGFTAVGIDEIGTAVGLTGPGLYRHFASKGDILTSIGRRSAARLEAGAIAAFSRTEDPAQLLAALVDSYVQVLTDSPDLVVSFTNARHLQQAKASDLAISQRVYVQRLIDLVARQEPELPAAEAAVTVHAALTIANDAMRVPGNWGRPGFPGLLAYLMKGALGLSDSANSQPAQR